MTTLFPILTGIPLSELAADPTEYLYEPGPGNAKATAFNAFAREHIFANWILFMHTEASLLCIKDFGRKSLSFVEESLHGKGRSLGMFPELRNVLMDGYGSILRRRHLCYRLEATEGPDREKLDALGFPKDPRDIGAIFTYTPSVAEHPPLSEAVIRELSTPLCMMESEFSSEIRSWPNQFLRSPAPSMFECLLVIGAAIDPPQELLAWFGTRGLLNRKFTEAEMRRSR